MTASIFYWYIFIIVSLTMPNTSKELRLLADNIICKLETAGFRDLFNNYTKHDLQDATFELEKS